MLDTFGFSTPQGSNYQEFYGGGTTRDWLKPRGASMVRMLLIGAGAGGRAGSTSAGGTGGGSGAVTEWIGPAIFIPDELRISIGAGGASASAGGNTSVIYQSKDGTGYTLLTANGAASGTAGTAFTNNFFGASGIFSSIAGQAGATAGNNIAASTTVFLSGGASGANAATTNAGQNVACNYGYPTISGGTGSTAGTGNPGFFLTQPIMIGAGGSGGGGSTTAVGGTGGTGGIGCGGGGGGRCTSGASLGGRGGDGAVFIWSW
jgi:hypothetical protein